MAERSSSASISACAARNEPLTISSVTGSQDAIFPPRPSGPWRAKGGPPTGPHLRLAAHSERTPSAGGARRELSHVQVTGDKVAARSHPKHRRFLGTAWHGVRAAVAK